VSDLRSDSGLVVLGEVKMDAASFKDIDLNSLTVNERRKLRKIFGQKAEKSQQEIM
jgi:hypothetical protein